MKRIIYDANFYKSQSGASSQSASAVAPILKKLLQPRSVVDIGCGVGTWLRAFCENGVNDVLGIDGEWVDRQKLQIPSDCFLIMDLTTLKSQVNRKFDLALCLEVAEHIPRNSAPRLIDFITSLAPTVCFSAAIPGQGGAGHLNEQWPDYWIRFFADRGYQCLDILRPRIWNIPIVEPWYRQNSFLFVKEGEQSRYPELPTTDASPAALPTRIVHPELFRRFVSLEYIRSGQLVRELLARVKRKLISRSGLQIRCTS